MPVLDTQQQLKLINEEQEQKGPAIPISGSGIHEIHEIIRTEEPQPNNRNVKILSSLENTIIQAELAIQKAVSEYINSHDQGGKEDTRPSKQVGDNINGLYYAGNKNKLGLNGHKILDYFSVRPISVESEVRDMEMNVKDPPFFGPICLRTYNPKKLCYFDIFR